MRTHIVFLNLRPGQVLTLRTIGGLLVEVVHRRAIFYFNVFLGLANILGATLVQDRFAASACSMAAKAARDAVQRALSFSVIVRSFKRRSNLIGQAPGKSYMSAGVIWERVGETRWKNGDWFWDQ